MDILSMITGLGLASGAGGRASLIAVLLGIFHYTQYFELSENLLWLASPPVMGILVAITLAEIYIDSDPTLRDFAHYPSYMTSFAVGFIALMAATGETDTNLLQLASSGLLGGGTALGTRYIRNEITDFVNDVGSAIGEKTANNVRSWSENGATVAIASTSILFPFVGIILVASLVGIGIFYLSTQKNNAANH